MSRARWLVLLETGDGDHTERLELVTDDRDMRVAERQASMQRHPGRYGSALLWAAATRTGAFKAPFEDWEGRQLSARMVEQLDDGLGGPPDPTDPESGDT